MGDIGTLFLAYANTYSATESGAIVSRFLRHLASQGIDLCQVLIQTDDGFEFDGAVVPPKGESFTHAIEQLFCATHRVVFGCPNVQSEVESVHNRVKWGDTV